MEEHEREDADPGHHAEGAGVVGEGGHDEPLVLIVTQRDNGDLKYFCSVKYKSLKYFCVEQVKIFDANCLTWVVS